MSEDTEIVSDMMRKGQYFEAAKSWYRTLYIGLIAERSFFLVIAILSFFIAIFAFISVIELLPVTSRPGLIIHTTRLDDTVFSASRIGVRGQPVNSEMLKFMIGAYVFSRESYQAATYARYSAFVVAHSDAPTATSYIALYGQNNPQSPAAILGERGTRKVTIDDLAIKDKLDSDKDKVTSSVATVRFTTELEGMANANKTQWTAEIQYYYSDLAVQEATNPETGESEIHTQDPQFQVVNYVLTKNQ